MRTGQSGAGTTRRRLPAVGLLAAGTAAVVGLTGCGSSTSGAGSAQLSSPSFSPNPSAFSGQPPSALASLASEGQASASARSATAAAAASAFAASVSAESARTTAAAKTELAKVSGSGNAQAEVGFTGLNRDRTGGLHAVVVHITNRSGKTANYAVRIDWDDSAGKLVDSSVVGAEKLAAGATAQPVAFSTKSADTVLTAKVAQAQRY